MNGNECSGRINNQILYLSNVPHYKNTRIQVKIPEIKSITKSIHRAVKCSYSRF